LDLIRDLPPGRSLEDKVVFSLEKYNTMVAIVDMLKDHPKKDVWWIGLMLIHPQFRNNGLGSQILDTIIYLLKKRSIPEIQIGVLEENSAAMHFWERQGFRVIESLPGRIFSDKTHTVFVMKLEI
jgi:ribosomal protein S18 acetylase RimI-like enzyme